MSFLDYFHTKQSNAFSDTELDERIIIASHVSEQLDEVVINPFTTEPNFND